MPYNLSTLTLITTPERKDYTASMSQEARQSIRQRLQAERGTIVKAAGQARIRFALAYPNTYFLACPIWACRPCIAFSISGPIPCVNGSFSDLMTSGYRWEDPCIP